MIRKVFGSVALLNFNSVIVLYW